MDLQEIKAALAAATPGAWTYETTPIVGHGYRIQQGTGPEWTFCHVERRKDAHLIANSPAWLAWAVGRIEELETWQREAVPYVRAKHNGCDCPAQSCHTARRLVKEAAAGEKGGA